MSKRAENASQTILGKKKKRRRQELGKSEFGLCKE
jgi:hypothetical protein